MHIIALAVSTSSMRGGIEKSMFDVCRGLHHRGHTISLLYEQEGDQIAQYQEFCHYIGKVDSFRISKQNLPSSTLKFFKSIWDAPNLKETIVYSHQYYSFFFGNALARFKNSSFACHLRLPAPRHLDLNLSNGLTVLKESINLSNVTRFIAVSEHVKTEWVNTLRLDPNKFDVVHNGIDINVFKPADSLSRLRSDWSIPENKKVIVYVGRLDAHKGVESLIEAFALLMQHRTDLQLLIAGKSVLESEDYEQSLHHLVVQKGLENDVRFLGYVKPPTVLYQLSDVMVVPSIWAEPFSRTVIESLACGTPVVGSRSGGTPEALTGKLSKYLFEPGEPQDLACVLNQVIDWREKEPILGTLCREHAIANFQIDRTVEGVEQSLMKAMKCSYSFNRAAV